MLGMAVLVPLILQEPIPAISSESQGVPEVSGRLDSTPRPEVFPDVSRDVPQETPPGRGMASMKRKLFLTRNARHSLPAPERRPPESLRGETETLPHRMSPLPQGLLP